jgi:folylpolyglutamate synthase
MLSCGSWFADMVAGSSSSSSADSSTARQQQQQQQQQQQADQQQVLLFNCMKERDPAALLPALARTLASRGVAVQHAAFVPPDSNFGFLPGSSKASSSAAQPAERDLSWQQHQQQQWEVALQDVPAAAAGAAAQRSAAQQAVAELAAQRLRPVGGGGAAAGAVLDSSRGVVAPSLQATVDWLRACVRARPQLRLQVLVTGSLYLVGDMLRLLGRAPQ